MRKESIVRQGRMRKPNTKWLAVYKKVLLELRTNKTNVRKVLAEMNVIRQDFYLWMDAEQKRQLKAAKEAWNVDYIRGVDEGLLINGRLVDRVKAA